MARRRITTTVTDLDEEHPRRRKRGDDPLRKVILAIILGLCAWGASKSCNQQPHPMYRQR